MKLSIITINYNNCDGLQKSIDSVVAQTWRDFEWIVIDGGSTDGSKELIEKYQSHFAYCCSEADKGVYNAMNKGITKATGDYLIFLNSGDFFCDNDVLQNVYSANRTEDIISGQVVRADNGKFLRRYDDNIFMQVFFETLNHQGTFIKRDLFNNRRYDETLKICSDWKFWIETIVLGDASVYVLPFVIASQDMNGISSDVDLIEKERTQVLDTFFSKSLQQQLRDFQTLRKSFIVKEAEHIQTHSIWGYRIIKRLIYFVSKIVGGK